MNRIKAFLSNSGRLTLIILLIAATFSFAMFQGGFVSWFLFFTLIPFLLYSLLLAFLPINISNVHREFLPLTLTRGDSASVKVSFRNKTWFPLIFVTIQEMGMDQQFYEKTNGRSSNIFFVGWRRNFEWIYEIPKLERGELRFNGFLFTFTDFFGWTVRRKVHQVQQTVLIYPKMTEVNYKPLQFQFGQGGVHSSIKVVKDNSLVTGIRDYQAGDRFSLIHWKSFAKNETLKTKEFEDRQSREVALVLDSTTSKNFELVVDFVASTLNAVVKKHGEISFLSVGKDRQYFPNLKTGNQLERVNRHLAVIKPDANQKIEAALLNEIDNFHSSTLLLVTGEITEQLEMFFVNSMNSMRGIVCFVVINDEAQKTKGVERKFPHVKVVYLTKDLFKHAFTEVLKP